MKRFTFFRTLFEGKKMFLLIFGLALGYIVSAQTAIYTQNFGNAGTAAGWTTSGSGWMGMGMFSSNYPGASGDGYLVHYLNTGGTLTSVGIATTGYESITVMWGEKRNKRNNAITATVEWSVDGTTWTPINYTRSANDGEWRWVNNMVRIVLPVGAADQADLKLRWVVPTRTGSGAAATFYAIDDFSVFGCEIATKFNVTGGGLKCNDETVWEVGLDGSEIGMAYQLLLDGANIGGLVEGTGEAISFGDQSEIGVYTVEVKTLSGECTSLMDGSAEIYADEVDPEISCPGKQTVNTDPGLCSAVIDLSDEMFLPEVTDDCAYTIEYRVRAWDTETEAWSTTWLVEWTDVPNVTLDKGLYQVRLRAIDESGNISSACPFRLTVVDEEAPVIEICGNQNYTSEVSDPDPEPNNDIEVDNDPGECGATVNFDDKLKATDNCDVDTVWADPESGSFFPVGETTVWIYAQDVNGNGSSCSFTVTVTDTEAPVFGSCEEENPTSLLSEKPDNSELPEANPLDITADNDEGKCGAEVDYPECYMMASDNCEIDTVIASPESGSMFDVGETTVIITATDIHGNSSTRTFTVTVIDAEAPTIECPGDITLYTSETEGKCEAYLEKGLGDPDVDDNCCDDVEEGGGPASEGYLEPKPCLTVTNDAPENGIYPKGETVVTWTVTDKAGNTATCTQTVTVVDDEAPVIGICEGEAPKIYTLILKPVTYMGTTVYRANLPKAKIKSTIIDNCDTFGDGLTVVFSQTVFTPADWGNTNNVNKEWVKVTDSEGNISECEFGVVVRYPLKNGEVGDEEAFDGLESTELNVHAYPNPTTGRVMLELSNFNNPDVTVQVMNITGQKVFEQNYRTEGFIEFDLTGNKTGMYLVSVLVDNRRIVEKITLSEQ